MTNVIEMMRYFFAIILMLGLLVVVLIALMSRNWDKGIKAIYEFRSSPEAMINAEYAGKNIPQAGVDSFLSALTAVVTNIKMFTDDALDRKLDLLKDQLTKAVTEITDGKPYEKPEPLPADIDPPPVEEPPVDPPPEGQLIPPPSPQAINFAPHSSPINKTAVEPEG